MSTSAGSTPKKSVTPLPLGPNAPILWASSVRLVFLFESHHFREPYNGAFHTTERDAVYIDMHAVQAYLSARPVSKLVAMLFSPRENNIASKVLKGPYCKVHLHWSWKFRDFLNKWHLLPNSFELKPWKPNPEYLRSLSKSAFNEMNQSEVEALSVGKTRAKKVVFCFFYFSPLNH